MIRKVTVKKKIRVNGKEYAGVDEMPSDIRQAYEQAIASLTDPTRDHPATDRVQTETRTKIIFNGHEYSDVQEMPSAVRQAYEEAMAVVEANPDDQPEGLDAGNAPSAVPPLSSPPVLTPSRANSTSPDTMLFLAGVVVLLLLVILAGLFGLLLLSGTILR